MPDEVTQPVSVTLSMQDWQIVRAALFKLPIEVGLATLQRFDQALLRPAEVTRLREVEP